MKSQPEPRKVFFCSGCGELTEGEPPLCEECKKK